MNTKEVWDERPTTDAYVVVLRDLRSRQAAGPQDGTRALIKHAIEALEALERAGAAQAAPGKPPPGSDEEIAQEIDMEKLDP